MCESSVCALLGVCILQVTRNAGNSLEMRHFNHLNGRFIISPFASECKASPWKQTSTGRDTEGEEGEDLLHTCTKTNSSHFTSDRRSCSQSRGLFIHTGSSNLYSSLTPVPADIMPSIKVHLKTKQRTPFRCIQSITAEVLMGRSWRWPVKERSSDEFGELGGGVTSHGQFKMEGEVCQRGWKSRAYGAEMSCDESLRWMQHCVTTFSQGGVVFWLVSIMHSQATSLGMHMLGPHSQSLLQTKKKSSQVYFNLWNKEKSIFSNKVLKYYLNFLHDCQTVKTNFSV